MRPLLVGFKKQMRAQKTCAPCPHLLSRRLLLKNCCVLMVIEADVILYYGNWLLLRDRRIVAPEVTHTTTFINVRFAIFSSYSCMGFARTHRQFARGVYLSTCTCLQKFLDFKSTVYTCTQIYLISYVHVASPYLLPWYFFPLHSMLDLLVVTKFLIQFHLQLFHCHRLYHHPQSLSLTCQQHFFYSNYQLFSLH